jgi:hypothetical protein
MTPLYQIVDSDHPHIQTRQAEAHDLAEHLLAHPFWNRSVRPTLSAIHPIDDPVPPRDGIQESANRVYLPPGLPAQLMLGLQSIIDGWVMNKDE